MSQADIDIAAEPGGEAPSFVDRDRPGAASAADLFRPEVLAAAQSRLGAPVRAFHLSGLLLTMFLVVVVSSVTVFAVTTQFSRKETAVGTIQPAAGAIRISSSRAGLISAVHVHDGDFVKPGAPLFTLTLDPTVATGRQVNTLLEEAADSEEQALKAAGHADDTLIASQLNDVDVRRQGLSVQVAEIDDQLKIQRQRVELDKATVEAATELYDRRYMSSLELRRRQDLLLEAEQEFATLEKQRSEATANLSALSVEVGRLKAQYQSERAQLARNHAELMEKRASTAGQGDIVLTAEQSGRIASLLARPGATASPGATLAVLLPAQSTLQAELWVPTKAIGFVNKGNRVQLLYDAFPYQRFGAAHGTVTEISDAPTNPQDLPPSVESKEALYRVVVALESQTVSAYGRQWPLLPGMKLNADIILERRTLFSWLLEPVRAARARES